MQKQSTSGRSAITDVPSSAPAFDIRLYDRDGMLQGRVKSKGQGTTHLNVSDLPDGVYLLHVYNSWNPLQPEVHTVIIKH